MKTNRNPEVKKETLIFGIITAVVAAICFCINIYSGLIMLAAGVFFIVLHIMFANKRYSRIAELSDNLDQILHGQERILVKDCKEGELAILSSEINKMILMLNEQSDQLLKEKVNLSEAIEDIFHQLRTPLTSLMLDAELLRAGNLSDDRRIGIARQIKKQLVRMQWLVESLLKMSKINAGTAVFVKDKISVKELLKKAEEPFRIQMELKGQEYECNVLDESFEGDFNWNVEAIGNLLKNCMEHTPEGGKITVDVMDNPLYTQILISDSGEGFSKEDIPYLFNRFYKGKNASTDSIGIGLALSRCIIAEQNGVITAQNKVDGGAQFTVKYYKCLTV